MCLCHCSSCGDFHGGAIVTFTVCAGGMLLLLCQGALKRTLGPALLQVRRFLALTFQGMQSCMTADGNFMLIAVQPLCGVIDSSMVLAVSLS